MKNRRTDISCRIKKAIVSVAINVATIVRELYAEDRKELITQISERKRRKYNELKNVLHLRNKDIGDILEIDRSTVTRDLQHIKQHPSRFKILLKDYMDRLQGRKETDDYRLRLTYQRQEHLNKWIGYAYSALDYLVRELDVSVS